MSVIIPPIQPRRITYYIIDASADSTGAGWSGQTQLIDLSAGTQAAIPANAVVEKILIDTTATSGQLATTTVSIDTTTVGFVYPSNTGFVGANFGGVYTYNPVVAFANPADSYLSLTASSALVGPLNVTICYVIPSDF